MATSNSNVVYIKESDKADTLTAIAGNNDDKYMTPKKTRSAIENFIKNGGGGAINIDGGNPDSNYGGIEVIDGGDVNGN